MLSAINVLTNSCNILDLIQRYVFQLNLSRINRKSGWKWCCAGLGSVWDPWTRWLPEGVLKQELLGIQVSTFFGVNSFQNICASNLISFFLNVQNLMYISKMQLKFEKYFLFFEIIALELVVGFSPSYEQHTCDGPSMC